MPIRCCRVAAFLLGVSAACTSPPGGESPSSSSGGSSGAALSSSSGVAQASSASQATSLPPTSAVPSSGVFTTSSGGTAASSATSEITPASSASSPPSSSATSAAPSSSSGPCTTLRCTCDPLLLDNTSAAFVEWAYCTVLQRPADPSGKAFNTARLDGFQLTRMGLYRELFLSPEFNAAANTAQRNTTRAYQALFLRDPDSGGLASWSTVDFAVLVDTFLESPEFLAAQPARVLDACSPARLDAAVDSNLDVASFLSEDCLRWPAAGTTVALPAGRYTLNHTLILKPIRSPVTLATQGADGQRCDHRACAELFASSAFVEEGAGVVRVAANGAILDSVVVNGNKQARRDLWVALPAPRPAFPPGVGVSIGNGPSLTGFEMRHCVVKDNPKATAVNPTAVDGFVLDDNLVTGCGWHEAAHGVGWWSDGITVNRGSHGTVTRNEVVDATDVALIFGACPDCSITGNTLRHTGTLLGAAWAELALQAWPLTSGDYTNTTVAQNHVDGSSLRRSGYGILVGNESWAGFTDLAGGTAAFGFSLHDNTVTNVLVGLEIDQATGPITVYANTITSCGGRYLYGRNTNAAQQQWLWSPAINVSPASLPFVTGAGGSTQLDFSFESFRLGAVLPMEAGVEHPAATQHASLSSSPVPNALDLARYRAPATNQDRVTKLYGIFFARAPDPGGLVYFTGRLDGGETVSALALAMVTSQEFAQRQPVTTLPADQLVAVMYQLAFGRVAEQAGLDDWVTRLNNNTLTRDAFLAAILGAAEFTNRF